MENIKVHPAPPEPAKETPKRIIKNPWWGNVEKTIVRCQFFMENGEILEASVSDTEEGNPDWYEIMETFGLEDIDKRTQAFIDDHEEQHRKEKEWKNFEIPETTKKQNIRQLKTTTTAIHRKSDVSNKWFVVCVTYL